MTDIHMAASSDHSHNFHSIIQAAAEELRKERRTGGTKSFHVFGDLAEIDDFANLVIIGDLHGDLASLTCILNLVNYEEFLKEPSNILVFLGDYIDRGPESVRVIEEVCLIKSRFPHNVILMRGNHESPQQFPFASHDLPNRIIDSFGRGEAKKIYTAVLDLFESLTLAVIVKHQMIIVHGGLPVTVQENYREAMSGAGELRLSRPFMEEILWNDPRDLDGWEISRRGYGKHFGKGVTDRWLSATNTRFVVRGHEPCRAFRVDQDGRVLTLFSSKKPYPSFDAGFLQVSYSELKECPDTMALSKYVRKLDL